MDVRKQVLISMPVTHWFWLIGFLAAHVPPGVENPTLTELERQVNEAIQR